MYISNPLKLADVVPIFKKNDMLNKMNYRPIVFYHVYLRSLKNY